MIKRFLPLLLILCTTSIFGQSVRDEWRTIETPHFRVHYPAAYEAWAQNAAARLEGARSIVVKEVGYEPREITDVVVQDPIAQANGSAWPFLGFPRMILWTSPPGASSMLANYGDWAGLLIIHEETHLVHMLRPSRSPLRNALAYLSPLPLGPITPAPRWVSEGYATVLEGDLTGYGRPNSEFRAAVLRQWALEGRMPSYAQLHSDSQSWMGMSMAYLVGSSYLEWLRAAAGVDSLRHLWARMTAKKGRSFESSFEGVFGDTPRAMYGRFVALTTRDAFAAAELVRPSLREGELWQDTKWTTDPPAASPDGKFVATVIRSRTEPPRLVVLSTSEPVEEEKKFKERIDKILKADPEDVAPVRSKPLERKPVHELKSMNGLSPSTPRWIDDDSILFTQFEPDHEGFLHPDLYVWNTKSGGLRRVTHLADVRAADPSADAQTVYAVRNRNGFSQLVKVESGDGGVTAISDPSVTTTYDSPRVSRDGRTLVYVRNRVGKWELVVRDLASNAERILALPDGASSVAYPSLARDGKSVFATVSAQGSIEVWEFDLAGVAAPRQVTRSTGASAAPEPTNDALFFLALTPDGFAMRRLALATARDPLPPVTIPLPRHGNEKLVVATSTPAPHAYLPRLEPAFLLGGTFGPSQRFFELTARFGDLVGKLDTTITGSYGNEHDARGVSVAARWRELPVDLLVQAYHANDGRNGFELDRDGGELRADWSAIGRPWRLNASGGLLAERSSSDTSGNRRIGSLQSTITVRPSIGSLAFPSGAAVLGQHGSTAGESWSRTRWSLETGVASRKSGVFLTYERGSASDSVSSERFFVGGGETALLPAFALTQTVSVPYLPPGTLTGDTFDRQRVVVAPGTPFSFFYERIGASAEGFSDHIRSGGIEISLDVPATPVVKVPNATITAGVARIFDGVLANRNEGWLSLHWRP